MALDDLVFSAPDGSTVLISGPVSLSGPMGASFSMARGDFATGFQVGPTGTAEAAMVMHEQFDFTDEFSHANGTVSVGFSDGAGVSPEGVGLGVLHLSRFELFTFGPCQRQFVAAFPSMLGWLEIDERQNGVIARPTRASGFTAYGTTVTLSLEPIGNVSVAARDPSHDRMLPDWRGAEVNGGELFHTISPHDDDESHFFILASTSAFAEIHVVEGSPSDPIRLAALAEMRVDWAVD